MENNRERWRAQWLLRAFVNKLTVESSAEASREELDFAKYRTRMQIAISARYELRVTASGELRRERERKAKERVESEIC